MDGEKNSVPGSRLAHFYDRVDRSYTCVLRGGPRHLDGTVVEVPAEWLPRVAFPAQPEPWHHALWDAALRVPPAITSHLYDAGSGEWDAQGRLVLRCCR